MNKNFLFSICLLVGAFSVKGQYKNVVSIDPFSFNGNLGLQYDRVIFSKNNNHISLKAMAGFRFERYEYAFAPGIEALYSYGNNHRLELGFGYSPTLKQYNYGGDSDFYFRHATFRIGYAYYAKDNPMMYRFGIMPSREFIIIQNQENASRWLGGLSIGIGYRF